MSKAAQTVMAVSLMAGLLTLGLFVFNVFGDGLLNPFQPQAVAHVQLIPTCVLGVCDLSEGNTYITFEKINTLDIISKQFQRLGLVIFGPCVPFVGGGGDFVLHFELPAAGYKRERAYHICPGQNIVSDFAFNYDDTLTFMSFELDVNDGTDTVTYFTKTGSWGMM